MLAFPSNSWESQHSRIEQLGRRQYGHVTRRQLLELGLSRSTIESRLRSGRLVAVHAGVYALGLPREDAPARAAAAVLACGPGALLSHGSAASVWDMERWSPRLEVTVATARERPGIVVHRSRTLTVADRRRQRGIWVTSVARTILDIAPRYDDRRLARIVNDARLARWLGRSGLADVLERCPNHPGAKRLRPFIDDHWGPTRSEFEDAFVEFAARNGLP